MLILFSIPVLFCSASVLARDTVPLSRPLVIWLIPMVRVAVHNYVPDPQELASFNKVYGRNQLITLSNTTDPVLRDQLLVRNPESPEPNWATILAQQDTLSNLSRFASQAKVRLTVRFLKWDRMFSALNQVFSRTRDPALPIEAPDIAQIGTSWVKHFEQYSTIQDSSQESSGIKHHLVAPGLAQLSFPYTTDLRMLFYWKQSPNSAQQVSPAELQHGDWQSLLEQLSRDNIQAGSFRAALVLPIGMTLNLLHDYAPMVWAGGGQLVSGNATMFDLSSKQALEIPHLLSKMATAVDATTKVSRRVISFPEMGHIEGIDHFLAGHYRSIIESVGFISHWSKDYQQRFATTQRPKEMFAKHAGVLPLPVSFRGGSALISFASSNQASMARQLIQFMINDEQHLGSLSNNGYLPGLSQRNTIQLFLKELALAPDHAREIEQSIQFAIDHQRSYPAMASWPTKVESPDVLEQFQKLWRRIAHGNQDGMALHRIKLAAEEAELKINRIIDPWTGLWYRLKEFWVLIGPLLLVALMIIVLLFYRTMQRQRGQMLALLLFKGKTHSLLHAYGSQICDFTLLPKERMEDALICYGTHIAERFNRQLAETVSEVCADISGKHRLVDLDTIISTSYQNAQEEYYAAKTEYITNLELIKNLNLGQWGLRRHGFLLVMVCQEWIFNTMKQLNVQSSATPSIDIKVKVERWKKELHIRTPIMLASRHVDTLKPTSSLLKLIRFDAKHTRLNAGQGLSLIRDLLWYGFRARVRVCSSKYTTLIIPLPLIRYRNK